MRIFTKIGVTFLYRIEITKFLARWKDCCEGYVMTWYRVYFGLSTISSSCDLQKGMVHSSGFFLWWHMSLMDRVHLILVCEPLYWHIYLKSLWRIWWWCCIYLSYDMIQFLRIMNVIMVYTLWCWCTPIQYDVHAYNSVMMLSYALWCIIDDDDA